MAIKATTLKQSLTKERAKTSYDSHSIPSSSSVRRWVKKASQDPLTFVLLVWVLAFLAAGLCFTWIY